MLSYDVGAVDKRQQERFDNMGLVGKFTHEAYVQYIEILGYERKFPMSKWEQLMQYRREIKILQAYNKCYPYNKMLRCPFKIVLLNKAEKDIKYQFHLVP